MNNSLHRRHDIPTRNHDLSPEEKLDELMKTQAVCANALLIRMKSSLTGPFRSPALPVVDNFDISMLATPQRHDPSLIQAGCFDPGKRGYAKGFVHATSAGALMDYSHTFVFGPTSMEPERYIRQGFNLDPQVMPAEPLDTDKFADFVSSDSRLLVALSGIARLLELAEDGKIELTPLKSLQQ